MEDDDDSEAEQIEIVMPIKAVKEEASTKKSSQEDLVDATGLTQREVMANVAINHKGPWNSVSMAKRCLTTKSLPELTSERWVKFTGMLLATSRSRLALI